MFLSFSFWVMQILAEHTDCSLFSNILEYKIILYIGSEIY